MIRNHVIGHDLNPSNVNFHKLFSHDTSFCFSATSFLIFEWPLLTISPPSAFPISPSEWLAQSFVKPNL